MNYFKIKILDDDYYIGYINNKITYISNPNQLNIIKWFKEAVYKDNIYLQTLTKKELTNYFLGNSKTIKIPFELIGTTFQKNVLNEVLNVKYGNTKSYKEIAVNLGDQKLARAVSRSLANNPLLFVIPCHRIIGTDNNLKGYRAGIELKRKLLNLEKNN